MSCCTFYTEDNGEIGVVKIVKELDIHVCGDLDSVVKRLSVCSSLVIDLSECEYMDSSGLGLLVSLSRQKRQRLILVDTSSIEEILRLTRMQEFFERVETVDEAIRRIREGK